MAAELNKFLKLLCPGEFVESVTQIDVKKLKSRQITALLVDLDNTLVPWQSYDIAQEVVKWIREAEQQGMEFCIVSNTRSRGRLKRLASIIGVPFVERSLKPRRAGFYEALKLLNVNMDNAAVIGDQIFTDILGGNRLGMHTILVRPLHPREFFGTKISRLFEKAILRFFERRGLLHRAGKSRPSGNNIPKTVV